MKKLKKYLLLENNEIVKCDTNLIREEDGKLLYWYTNDSIPPNSPLWHGNESLHRYWVPIKKSANREWFLRLARPYPNPNPLQPNNAAVWWYYVIIILIIIYCIVKPFILK